GIRSGLASSVDRLGRSLQDLVGFLSELHALKIDLFLRQQGLDTTTPAGKAMFQMMGVFAEFERAMIFSATRFPKRNDAKTGASTTITMSYSPKVQNTSFTVAPHFFAIPLKASACFGESLTLRIPWSVKPRCTLP